MIKLIGTRWAGHVDEEFMQHSDRKNEEGRDHFEDLSIDGRILMKERVRMWSLFTWVGIRFGFYKYCGIS
jgi:hypothetical protein